MDTLNPNHPVTQKLNDDLFHKILALYMWKSGTRSFDITVADIRAFPADLAVVVKDSAGQPGGMGRMEIRLVTRAEGEQLARAQGGRPF